MKLFEELEHFFVAPTAKAEVVVRIAPSPTGFFHVGTARAALFNYLFARHHGGKFLVRIEDTDKARSKAEFDTDIIESLKWLGLQYDALSRQSERTQIYTEHLEKLLQNGKAYLSKEKSTDDQSREVEVVRLRSAGKTITFNDLIHGDISFDTTELGDFVIARSRTEPLYHFAVVVDDTDMRVTHVIRGEDHISNTPRQILIQEALGFKRPVYAHLPLILAPDRSKLSKRHGATSVQEYRSLGYLPEAFLNYLALLGWNPGTEQELFSLSELVASFDIKKIHKSGAVFNKEKLDWFNREYLRKLPTEILLKNLEETLPETHRKLPQYSKERLKKMLPTLLERISTLSDISALAEKGEISYFFDRPVVVAEKLPWKKDEPQIVKKHLAYLLSALSELSENNFTAPLIKESIWEYASKEGRGSVLWPLRMALSGREQSPDPFAIAEILGKEETLARLTGASATIG
ncbi:MAG TPA: glutamate--tRNA ligase [Candidatus Paceibacterota bacterium]